MAEEEVEVVAASMKKNKVMVAIDDSEYSQHALNWALNTLRSTMVDSEVIIYTARTPVDIGYLYASSWGSKYLFFYIFLIFLVSCNVMAYLRIHELVQVEKMGF
ncbi:putative rossmann-like alpha/beta/alpha sandwich protein [Helianthus debilis subsp. tardiflorus]